MPPINHLNPPPNPFWDFVADMQDHPFFGAYGRQARPYPQPQQHQNAEATSSAAANSDTNATASASKEKQPEANAEDPPEVDPATLRDQARQKRKECGRGRRHCGSGSDEEGERREWGGRRGWGPYGRHRGGPGGSDEEGERREWGGRRGWGPHGGRRGGPLFPFGGPPLPFWAGPGAGQDAAHDTAPGAHPHGPPPPGFGPAGPHGRGDFHRRGGPPHFHAHGPHGRYGQHRHHHGPRGPSPPPGPPGGFDLRQFLKDLGARIGVDLSGAAEGLGLDRFMPPHGNPDVDFEPKADIFERHADYIVHISLPGAKKSDVGVDWDGEHSTLRVAGVVHRPEVDEEMLGQLIVDGRKRETGVFEKAIRLGTRRDPATVDVAGIKAKMTDGVLVITVPKTEKTHEKREVPITKSQTPSPNRYDYTNKKHVSFDTDAEMRDTVPAPASASAPAPVSQSPDHEITLVDLTREEEHPAVGHQNKQAEHEAEQESQKLRERSATMEAEPAEQQEQLPAYHPVESHVHEGEHEHSDWENFGSEDEGDFVKINVD